MPKVIMLYCINKNFYYPNKCTANSNHLKMDKERK